VAWPGDGLASRPLKVTRLGRTRDRSTLSMAVSFDWMPSINKSRNHHATQCPGIISHFETPLRSLEFRLGVQPGGIIHCGSSMTSRPFHPRPPSAADGRHSRVTTGTIHTRLPARVANVFDHLIELRTADSRVKGVQFERLTRHTVAPRRDDRCKRPLAGTRIVSTTTKST